MLKIYADNNIPYLKEALKDISELNFYDSDQITNSDLKDADVLFTRTAVKVNEKLLKDTSIQFVATATSGIDHYDTDWLEKNNIAYSNALGSNANSVAEYVIVSILEWAIENDINLSTKTIGIIGYGNVGSCLGEYARRLGLTVLINDPPKKDEGFEFPEFTEYYELDELIQNSDIISNHVPRYFDGKYKTINLLAENLQHIQEGVLFIHASRGKVVNEKILSRLIDEKEITAIIDVWADEPNFNHELAKKAKLYTQHIAGHTLDGKILGTKMVLEAFQKHFKNRYIPDYTIINEILNQHQKANEEDYDNLIGLHDKIAKERRLQEDMSKMNELFDLPKVDAGKAFLDFRQNYPVRRETL